MKPPFTQQDDELIVALWPIRTVEYIGSLINNSSADRIRRRARLLGLPPKTGFKIGQSLVTEDHIKNAVSQRKKFVERTSGNYGYVTESLKKDMDRLKVIADKWRIRI